MGFTIFTVFEITGVYLKFLYRKSMNRLMWVYEKCITRTRDRKLLKMFSGQGIQ